MTHFPSKAPGLEVVIVGCLGQDNYGKCDNQGDWGQEDRLVAEHDGDNNKSEERQGKAETV